MTNKYRLQQALRAIHYALGYVQAVEVSTKDNGDIKRNTVLQNLNFAEETVLALIEDDHSRSLQ